jgi:hypothetical protein
MKVQRLWAYHQNGDEALNSARHPTYEGDDIVQLTPISIPDVPANEYPGGIPVPFKSKWGTLNRANSVNGEIPNTELGIAA